MQTRLLALKKRITDYEKKFARDPGSVSLLAVSKKKPAEKIAEAFDAGQFAFGENYLQEALSKMKLLADKPIEWHFIGPIQSNKTRKIAGNFSWVHSIDDVNIAKRLNDQRPAHLPPLNICIEVNISKEPSKSGILIHEVIPLAQYCNELPRLSLRGLMAIPTPHDNFIDQRNEFHQLFSIWQTLRKQNIMLDTLSMGMSADFEAAIAEGATIIRIGTAIFGSRDLP